MKKIGYKLFYCTLLVSLFLFGCCTDVPIQEESCTSSENVVETEENEFNLSDLLVSAEEHAADLQKKLTEDSSLTQTDMNQISLEIYKTWDDLLNDLWAVLNDTLDESTMNRLLEEQRAWINTKEDEVKKAGEAFAGGSMAPLVSNQKAAELTKSRVYELATYLSKPENQT